MCTQPDSRECGVSHEDGSIWLSPQAVSELLAAMGQMELLLRTRCPNAGLRYLVDMLRHLRVLGRKVGLTDSSVEQEDIGKYRCTAGRLPK